MASEQEKTPSNRDQFIQRIADIVRLEPLDSSDEIFLRHFSNLSPQSVSSTRVEKLKRHFQKEYEKKARDIKREIFGHIQSKMTFLESKFSRFIEDSWLPILGLGDRNSIWYDPISQEVLLEFMVQGGLQQEPSRVEERIVSYDPQSNVDVTFVEEKFVFENIPPLQLDTGSYQLACQRKTVVDTSSPDAPFSLGYVLEEIGFVRLPGMQNDLS